MEWGILEPSWNCSLETDILSQLQRCDWLFFSSRLAHRAKAVHRYMGIPIRMMAIAGRMGEIRLQCCRCQLDFWCWLNENKSVKNYMSYLWSGNCCHYAVITKSSQPVLSTFYLLRCLSLNACDLLPSQECKTMIRQFSDDSNEPRIVNKLEDRYKVFL